jgi:hypothetical protein
MAKGRPRRQQKRKLPRGLRASPSRPPSQKALIEGRNQKTLTVQEWQNLIDQHARDRPRSAHLRDFV